MHSATQSIAAAVVTVYRMVQRVVQLQLVVHREHLRVVPVRRGRGADVNQPHRVVAPMRDGYRAPVGRCGDHLRQRTRLHQTDNGIGLRVDDSHGRRILRVNVERAAIVRHPQVASVVRERALHRLSRERVQVLRVVPPGVKPGLGSPQRVVAPFAERVAYHLQLRVRREIVADRRATFQRIDVVFLTVGMDID